MFFCFLENMQEGLVVSGLVHGVYVTFQLGYHPTCGFKCWFCNLKSEKRVKKFGFCF